MQLVAPVGIYQDAFVESWTWTHDGYSTKCCIVILLNKYPSRYKQKLKTVAAHTLQYKNSDYSLMAQKCASGCAVHSL